VPADEFGHLSCVARSDPADDAFSAARRDDRARAEDGIEIDGLSLGVVVGLLCAVASAFGCNLSFS
jgi:hypothetical protein